VYGREATPEEINLGLEYLKTEPMLGYEEGKKKASGGDAACGVVRADAVRKQRASRSRRRPTSRNAG
jgi:hypothetical protein